MTKFHKWIKNTGGAEKVAALIGVTHRNVYFWTARKTTPRASTIQKLIRVSKGHLTFTDIVSATQPK